jgi:hypothetical protein
MGQTIRAQNNFSPELNGDEILDIKVEQNKTKRETKRRVLEDGDPEPAPKQRSKENNSSL